jgi:tetratricopeptide (TPR) repeat protein
MLCFGVRSTWGRIPASHLQEALQLKEQVIQLAEQGQYDQAAHIGEQLLARLEKEEELENDVGAEILNVLGELHTRMGKYTEAITLLQRAVAIREKVLGLEHPYTAYTLNNLAWAYLNGGHPEKALPLCQRAVSIFEKAKGPDHPEIAKLLKDLGTAYLSVGDKEKALAIDQRALAIEEKALGPDHPDISVTLNNLASIYLAMEDSKPALPLLQRALAIKEKHLGSEHSSTAVTISLLGRFYLRNGDIDKGYEFLQRALAIQEKVLGLHHPDTLVTRDDLLSLPVPKVLPLLQQLLEDKEKTLGPDHPETIYTRTKLANGYELQEDYQKALQLFERNLQSEDQGFMKVLALLTEDQKRKFAEELLINYQGALWTIRTAFLNDEAAVRAGLEFVLRRKGIVLDIESHAQESLAANLRGETLQSWQRLTQYRSELSHLLITVPEERNFPKKKSLEDLQAAITREEEFLAQHNPLMAKALPQWSISTQEVARHLPQDSALVEFVRIWNYRGIFVASIGGGREWMDNSFVAYSIAFVLTPDNHVTLVDLGRIDYKIMGLMSIVNAKSHNDLKADTIEANNALAELYNLLLHPLEAALGSRKQLIISPDGELNEVPFAALRTPDGHYLIEKTTVSYVSSG